MAIAPGTPTITVTLLTKKTGAAARFDSDKVWAREHSWTYTADEIDEARTKARAVDTDFNTGYEIPGKAFKVTCKHTVEPPHAR